MITSEVHSRLITNVTYTNIKVHRAAEQYKNEKYFRKNKEGKANLNVARQDYINVTLILLELEFA